MPVAEEIPQSADQVRMKLISQLLKSISRVLQKLLKCFNGTSVSISFVLPAARAVAVILNFNLNDSESAKVVLG